MRNVKCGDLALVVGDAIGTQLAASLVTVLKFLGREDGDGYGTYLSLDPQRNWI